MFESETRHQKELTESPLDLSVLVSFLTTRALATLDNLFLAVYLVYGL